MLSANAMQGVMSNRYWVGITVNAKDSHSLREENYLTSVNVSFLKIKYNKQPKSVKGQNPYKTELDFLYANEFRNNIIKNLCTKFKNNSLVLVNHLIHHYIGLNYYSS